MRLVRFSLAILTVFLILLAGCNSKAELKPSGQGEARAEAKATQSNLKLALATDPQTPAEEKPFTMRVHVSDAAGAAVADAQLHGALTMTSMDHGQQEFDFISKGNGAYEASSSAAMEGPWQVKITAKRGADVAELTSPITIVAK